MYCMICIILLDRVKNSEQSSSCGENNNKKVIETDKNTAYKITNRRNTRERVNRAIKWETPVEKEQVRFRVEHTQSHNRTEWYTQTKMLKFSKIYMFIELFHIVMVMLIVVIKIFLALQSGLNRGVHTDKLYQLDAGGWAASKVAGVALQCTFILGEYKYTQRYTCNTYIPDVDMKQQNGNCHFVTMCKHLTLQCTRTGTSTNRKKNTNTYLYNVHIPKWELF